MYGTPAPFGETLSVAKMVTFAFALVLGRALLHKLPQGAEIGLDGRGLDGVIGA